MPFLRGIVGPRRLGWKLRGVVGMAACSALLALPGLALGADVGVVPDITWGDSSAQIDQTISLLKQAGVQWVRTNVPWNALEQNGPSPDNPGYLSNIDYAIS